MITSLSIDQELLRSIFGFAVGFFSSVTVSFCVLMSLVHVLFCVVVVRGSCALLITDRVGPPIVSLILYVVYRNLGNLDIAIRGIKGRLRRRSFFLIFFLLKSPAPPLGYLGNSAHIPRSSSICFIHNMYRYSIQIQDGPVWSGLEN